MKKKIENRAVGRGVSKPKYVTEGKFIGAIESLKDLIISTAKGTETVLKKEIQGVRDRVALTEHAITEHSKMIIGLGKKVDALDTKIDNVRTELKDEIQGTRSELKDEMHQMEGRLSTKIDAQSARLEDHEVRISALE